MLSHVRIEKLTRSSIRSLEIKDFMRRTSGVTLGSFHFLTLTQDKSSSTESDRTLLMSFGRFIKKARKKVCFQLGKHGQDLSYIVVTENGDKASVRKHVHAIIFVPDKHKSRFHNIFYSTNPSKAGNLWRKEHYRGSFNIQPIEEESEVERVFRYSTKQWGRNIELNDCGINPPMRTRISDYSQQEQRNGETLGYRIIASSGTVAKHDAVDLFTYCLDCR